MNAKKAKLIRKAARRAIETNTPFDRERLTKAGRRAVAMADRKLAKSPEDEGTEGT